MALTKSPWRCFWAKTSTPAAASELLQRVVDGDKGIQGLGGGTTVEFLLLVVEGFGVGPAVHGTLA